MAADGAARRYALRACNRVQPSSSSALPVLMVDAVRARDRSLPVAASNIQAEVKKKKDDKPKTDKYMDFWKEFGKNIKITALKASKRVK